MDSNLPFSKKLNFIILAHFAFNLLKNVTQVSGSAEQVFVLFRIVRLLAIRWLNHFFRHLSEGTNVFLKKQFENLPLFNISQILLSISVPQHPKAVK